MSNNREEEEDDHHCPRCHVREKFFETFKKCFYCSRKHCNQCWTELQMSDDSKLLIDILPKVHSHPSKRICPVCRQILLQRTLKTFDNDKPMKTIDEDYQLALAMSLSQQEEEQRSKQKRKFQEEKIERDEEDLLQKIAQSIERFVNRAKSNCK